MIRKLLDNGREPWRIREVTGYRDWLLTRALQLCVGTISFGPDSTWAQQAKALYFEGQKAAASLRFQYDDEDASVRRAGSPIIRLGAVGRPLW